MKEIVKTGPLPHQPSSSGLEYFEIVHNYRQLLCKKRRKVLRKVNDERKKRMHMIQTEHESHIEIESEPHIDNYFSNEPWDILMDDSARNKSFHSSTNSFQHHPISEPKINRNEKTTAIGQIYNDLQPKSSLFSNIFLPFAFESP